MNNSSVGFVTSKCILSFVSNYQLAYLIVCWLPFDDFFSIYRHLIVPYNVSGNRCESDCSSRGHKFDPGPLPYFSLEIDHEIISMVILLPSAGSFKKGCCQIQAKVCARSTSLIFQASPGKSVIR